MKNNDFSSSILIKHLGLVDYEESYSSMHDFTQHRDESTLDEIWVLEHPQIFTQGRAGKEEHILKKSTIPIFQSDRGGQVTFHAPGQIIIYPLINLKRHNLNIRQFVTLLEDAVINTLAKYSIHAYARKDAPGVYVNNHLNPSIIEISSSSTIVDNKIDNSSPEHVIEKKICSLGLKVSRGCTLHGLALNVDLDLAPFDFINPCGLLGMQMTSMAQICSNPPDKAQITNTLIEELLTLLKNSRPSG